MEILKTLALVVAGFIIGTLLIAAAAMPAHEQSPQKPVTVAAQRVSLTTRADLVVALHEARKMLVFVRVDQPVLAAVAAAHATR